MRINNINSSRNDILSSNNLDISLRRKLEEELQWLRARERLTRQLLKTSQHETISLNIFSGRHGILEALCLHLHDEGNWTTKRIAERLKRSYSTIANTLRAARAKGPLLINKHAQTISTPVAIFRGKSPLQAIVFYLHNEGMRFSEIGRALGRDARNIYTTYKSVEVKQ
ncbi:helix-turn-helix domain-containing protein [Candidatus Woesearchaeota archaeon]|nr:helix-turn-helix domain-containing protein [Candidatus Woesearchaeota archaeon]